MRSTEAAAPAWNVAEKAALHWLIAPHWYASRPSMWFDLTSCNHSINQAQCNGLLRAQEVVAICSAKAEAVTSRQAITTLATDALCCLVHLLLCCLHCSHGLLLCHGKIAASQKLAMPGNAPHSISTVSSGSPVNSDRNRYMIFMLRLSSVAVMLHSSAHCMGM
jgi:hypothetical protein